MPLPARKKGEKKKEFIERCMGSDVMRKEFPDASQRRAVCERQSSKTVSKADSLFRGCCEEILCKQDIPHVELVIDLVDGIMRRHWVVVSRDMVDVVIDRLSDLSDEIPIDELDFAMIRTEEANEALEDLILAVLGSIVEVARTPFDSGTRRTLLSSARSLLEQGAVSRRLSVDLDLPRSVMHAQDALSEMKLLMAGRVTTRREQLKQAIGSYLTNRSIRTEPGLGTFRRALALIYDPEGGFIRPSVDAWAYRWHNVGSFEAMTQAGVERIIAFNNPPGGPDGRTTPFCRWVHGKTIDIKRIEDQLDVFKDAVRNEDTEGMIKSWPLLNFTGKETKDDFEAMYSKVGLPPYHVMCRTQALPG